MINYVLVSIFVIVVSAVGQPIHPLSSLIEGNSISRLFLQYCTTVKDCHSIFYYRHGSSEDPFSRNFIGDSSSSNTNPQSQSPNVIFIQPPDIKYKHNILLGEEKESNIVSTVGNGLQQQTTVYVLPQKDEHSINITDNRILSNDLAKPTVLYLENHPEGNDYTQFHSPPPEQSFSEVQMRYTITAN